MISLRVKTVLGGNIARTLSSLGPVALRWYVVMIAAWPKPPSSSGAESMARISGTISSGASASPSSYQSDQPFFKPSAVMACFPVATRAW